MLDVIDLNDMRTNVLKHTWSEISSRTMMCNTWGDISWAHSTHRPWVLQVLLFDLYTLRWAFTHNYHLVIHWCHLMVYIGIWNIIYVNHVFVTLFFFLFFFNMKFELDLESPVLHVRFTSLQLFLNFCLGWY